MPSRIASLNSLSVRRLEQVSLVDLRHAASQMRIDMAVEEESLHN